MNRKIVIVHGNGGTTRQDCWYESFKDDLETQGERVLLETMPDNVLARSSVWLPYLKNDLGCDENTIITGHSSGGAAALRFAEKNKVLGLALVAAHFEDFGIDGEKLSGYFDEEFDWDAIKANTGWILQFASIDDPYIAEEHSRELHRLTNSELTMRKKAGHFTDLAILGLSDAILTKVGKN
jgi:uncharacterized protein